jgi:arylsulfatase A-like enzyme
MSANGIVRKPNILLIVLDTTRVDRLSSYGYTRRTSPNLDKLANESVVYTRAIANSNSTLPSHASLFTGKLPYSHGAKYDPKGPVSLSDAVTAREEFKIFRTRTLTENEKTLAELLKQDGYFTGAVVAGPWLKKVFGLHKGFDFYDDDNITTTHGRKASDVTRQAGKWLKKNHEKNFFLFLNYFDPHSLYTPPKKFSAAFSRSLGEKPTKEDKINAYYDGEILYMDHFIGLVLDLLKVFNVYENTWIIVTADHGELLGEHGMVRHSKSLYQEEVYIPLMMKYPKGEVKPYRSDMLIQLIDILPTICKRLNITMPEGIQGMAPPGIEHPIIAETYCIDYTMRAIFRGNYKFIWKSNGVHMLFNLKDDPSENNNLIKQDVGHAKSLEDDLKNYLSGLPNPGQAGTLQKVDNDTQEALKSLGYIE